MFRFTIRDVLWLTVVVALAVGWTVDRWRQSHVRQEAEWQRDSLIFLMERDGHLVDPNPERVHVYKDGTHWTVMPDGSYQRVGVYSQQRGRGPAKPAKPAKP